MSRLFTPFSLGPLELPNRIVVSPMCQYSANDGVAGDWHLHHLMQFGYSGAGLVMVEATGVERRGRITHRCLGLYSYDCEAALTRIMKAARRVSGTARFGIQLAHAGRKASANIPWEKGGAPLGEEDDPWTTVAPSAAPFGPGWQTPEALDESGMARIVNAFVEAAHRAARIGFEIVEVHAAHGYLLHEFLSPLSNFRRDSFGGDLENRMRFPLNVVRAVREAVPHMVVGARITGNDWDERGLAPEDAVAFARELKALGVGYVCVSSGGILPSIRVPSAPGYNVPAAATVKEGADIPVRAVGMIITPEQAEEIVVSGRADMVCMARAFLDNPRWVWHAAEMFGATVPYPRQYERAKRSAWPGAGIVRPLKPENS
jgi:2,4-dienoyl-CoA reductase-like NADH-dependent reductase (Old Yellow Enzyme family)